MPLHQGDTKEIISANIIELIKAGKSEKEAVSIAYAEAGKSNK